jgi:hypothetical protein
MKFKLANSVVRLVKNVTIVAAGAVAVSVGLSMLGLDPAHAQTATSGSGGIFGWGLQMLKNQFGMAPSAVAFTGLIGGSCGVGIGGYSLYHHIQDGGRMAEKTGTIIGTGMAAALMSMPIWINNAQVSNPTGSGTLTTPTVQIN